MLGDRAWGVSNIYGSRFQCFCDFWGGFKTKGHPIQGPGSGFRSLGFKVLLQAIYGLL